MNNSILNDNNYYTIYNEVIKLAEIDAKKALELIEETEKNTKIEKEITKTSIKFISNINCVYYTYTQFLF